MHILRLFSRITHFYLYYFSVLLHRQELWHNPDCDFKFIMLLLEFEGFPGLSFFLNLTKF